MKVFIMVPLLMFGAAGSLDKPPLQNLSLTHLNLFQSPAARRENQLQKELHLLQLEYQAARIISASS